MIFVTVGTNEARFDRLLRAVAALPPGERIVVQHGHSTPIQHPDVELVDFLPFDDMTSLMREARAVVTHAGVGSVIVTLSNGKRPIVVPRRKEFGEAVDDHQLQLGRRFADAHLVTFVPQPEDLAVAIAGEHVRAEPLPKATSLAAELRCFVEATVAA
jgi:UDP-N-acetylglucosamine transferase subunit ALG13